MSNSCHFLDPLHVKGIWVPNLGHPRQLVLVCMIVQFDRQQKRVLKYSNGVKLCAKRVLGEVWWFWTVSSYSKLLYLTTTSQGAACHMAAALRNRIRSVEPQKMRETVLLTQRSHFKKTCSGAVLWSTSTPSRGNAYSAANHGSRAYQSTVKFLTGTNQMEANVRSYMDGSVTQRVVLSTTAQMPPSCCAFSRDGKGFHVCTGWPFRVRNIDPPTSTDLCMSGISYLLGNDNLKTCASLYLTNLISMVSFLLRRDWLQVVSTCRFRKPYFRPEDVQYRTLESGGKAGTNVFQAHQRDDLIHVRCVT